MADNVGYTPGTGATIATDEIDGKHYQRIKLAVGADGVTDGDVSSANPLPVAAVGELIEAIQAQRYAIDVLARTIGQSYPDSAGRLRVVVDTTSSLNVNTVTSVTSVTSATNLVQLGGISANDAIGSLMRSAADCVRRNISVS